MLLPLALPPGVMANGTELQAAGRWRDASLVRWLDGTMRPVGGWEAWHPTTLTTAPRAALAWVDNSAGRRLALATYNQVVVVSESGTATDITPAGLTAGTLDAAVNTGYGGGFYGAGTYGTPRTTTTYGEATTWALDTWGQELIACSNADGRIWRWDLNTTNDLVAVTNAPTGCLSALVTSERFILALGPGGNPRKVQWCDREDYTTWTPAATNEAGDLELQTAGQIMGGLRVGEGALIVTDQDAHLAVYQGPPFVYGFRLAGSACGTASRRSPVAVDGRAFWMGTRAFFAYAGGQVAQIPCEVSDEVFENLNRAQQSKVYGVANAQFGEAWWFYPSGDSVECNRYVAYNYRENHWALGSLARTCGVDRDTFAQPIWIDAAGAAFSHETGIARDTAAYAETGPVQLGGGDAVMACTRLIPDEATQGDVEAVFRTRFHPNGAETTHGPYSLANPTSVRFTGRQTVMRVQEARASDWRVGVMRLEAVQGGRR